MNIQILGVVVALTAIWASPALAQDLTAGGIYVELAKQGVLGVVVGVAFWAIAALFRKLESANQETLKWATQTTKALADNAAAMAALTPVLRDATDHLKEAQASRSKEGR